LKNLEALQLAGLALLRRLALEDPENEGVPDSFLICNDDGLIQPELHVALIDLATHGLVTRSDHFTVITPLGLAILQPPLQG